MLESRFMQVSRGARARLPKEDEEGSEAVVCRLCGKTYRAIAYSHLRRIHKWEGRQPVEEYKRRYGLPTVTCRETRHLMTRRRNEHWERRGHHWTRGRILEALQGRARAGQPLAPARLGDALGLAITRHFGTWDRALARAGLDPRAHRIHGRWRGDAVVTAIHERRRTGSSLAATVVHREDPSLFSAALHQHRSWGRALRAAGLDPSVYRLPKKWSLAKARDWVRTRQAQELPITAVHVPHGLYGHVVRKTGAGWAAFVESLGITYPEKKVWTRWSKESVIAAIREHRRRGQPLYARAMLTTGARGLFLAAYKRFGSWDAALAAAGIDASTIRKRRTWSHESVIAAVRKTFRGRPPVSRTAACAKDSGLVQVVEARFGGRWRAALPRMGFAVPQG